MKGFLVACWAVLGAIGGGVAGVEVRYGGIMVLCTSNAGTLPEV